MRHKHTYTHTHTHRHTHTQSYTNTHTDTHTHAHTKTHTDTHTYVSHTYTHTTHTNTHTHTAAYSKIAVIRMYPAAFAYREHSHAHAFVGNTLMHAAHDAPLMPHDLSVPSGALELSGILGPVQLGPCSCRSWRVHNILVTLLWLPTLGAAAWLLAENAHKKSSVGPAVVEGGRILVASVSVAAVMVFFHALVLLVYASRARKRAKAMMELPSQQLLVGLYVSVYVCARVRVCACVCMCVRCLCIECIYIQVPQHCLFC